MTLLIKKLLNERRFYEIKKLLECEVAADCARRIEEFNNEEMAVIFRILSKKYAAEVFSYMQSESQQTLIESFSKSEIGTIFENIFLDDVVDIIEEMPSNIVKKILNSSSENVRKNINKLLKYPKNSAGSIMTPEYVSLKSELTVDEAFSRIRKVGIDKETIYTCYVTTDDRRLIGIVSVKSLLLSQKTKKISEIMDENFKFVTTQVDRETVAGMFRNYDLLALPVVDFEGRIVGIVTVDDVIDVINLEATEDIEAMAAIVPTDKPYIKTGIFETYIKRIPWLLILMISATFTGAIINGYQNALSGYVILTAFIPMLMDTGGNSGSQASVSIIRSISLNEITIRDTFRVLWKEIRVAFLCGITLSALNFAKLIIIDRVPLVVAAVVCSTLIITVLVAKSIGCILPIVAKSIRLDPAIVASPFITTIVDAISLVVYFNIATVVLKI